MESKKESQNKRILAFLEKHGNISQIEALNFIGCMRLASRIHNLKNEPYNCKFRTVMTPTKDGRSFYAVYHLIK